jgi:PAS domain S-box-containing protein
VREMNRKKRMTDPLIRILYIDDYPLDRALVRDALLVEAEGFELSEARTRQEVEAFLESETFDLVLSDFNILGYTGLQVLEAVQARAPQTPVIIVTGTGSEQIAVEALKSGAADYIVKTQRSLRHLPHAIHLVLERQQAENDRRESERRYRALFEQVNDAVFVYDLEGCHLMVNQCACDLLGYSHEELIKLSVWDTTAEPDKSEGMLARFQAGEHIPVYERMLRKKDSSLVPVEINAELVCDRQGNPLHIQSIVRDITERKQAEGALRESEEKFRALYDNAPLAYQSLDENGCFIDVNPAWLRTLGYEREEVIGQGFAEFLHPDWKADFEKNFLEFKQRGCAFDKQYKIRHKDGHYLDISLDGQVGYWPDGNYRQSFCVFQDITGRVQAEQALQESEERFRGLYENAAIGIYRTTPDGRILMANPAAARMLGYESIDDLVKRDLELEGYEPSYPRSEFHRRLEEEGVVTGLESAWVRKDGSVIHVRESSRAIRNEKGDIQFYDGTFEDVTERVQAEQALRESEEQLRLIIDTMPSLLAYVDAEQRYLYVNQAYADWYGYAKEEMFGKYTKEVLSEVSYQDALPNIEAVLAGQNVSFENIAYDKNGRMQVVKAVYTPRLDQNGDVKAFLALVEDITERRQAEEALAISETKYRSLVESSAAGIASINMEGQFTLVNLTLCDMVGYSEDELLGSPFVDILHPDDLGKMLELFQGSALDPTARPQLEFRIVHKDGHVVFCYSVPAIMWNNEDIAGFSAIIQDVTERVQAEKELQESEERYRQLVELSPDGISVHSEGKLVFVNPAAVKLLAASSAAELLGKPALEMVHPDFRGSAQERIRQALQQGSTAPPFAEKFMRLDGTAVDVEVSAIPITYQGKPAMQVITRDITERVLAEEKIVAYSEKLEEMVAERTRELQDAQEKILRQERLATLGQVAAGVAQELRNPLAVIANAVYYLRSIQPEADEKVKAYLEIIESERRTTEKIATDLLDFTSPLQIYPEQISIPEIVQQTLDRIPRPEQIEVTTRFPKRLKEIRADRQQTIQVLHNLIQNAYQSIQGEGKVSISAQTKGDTVAILIADTGEGIRPEDMERLFEPLFTTKPRGIGMGLAIVHKLVEANAGRIEVHSQLGKGSRFSIILPVYEIRE